jgi:hypothetical protein
MLKVRKFDVAAPGLVTKTNAEPTSLKKEEGTIAVTSVLLTKVVFRLLLADCQLTIAFARKFEPITVRVRSALPTIALVGMIELTVGTVGGGGSA